MILSESLRGLGISQCIGGVSMAKITLKSIVKDICYAQCCSDAGKYIYMLSYFSSNAKVFNKCEYFAYEDKAFYIKRAIDQIRHAPYVGVNYYIDIDMRENYIVYFNIKVGDKRYQVSFHVPGFDNNNKLLWEYQDFGRRPIRWKSSHSSRDNCIKLIKIFNL